MRPQEKRLRETMFIILTGARDGRPGTHPTGQKTAGRRLQPSERGTLATWVCQKVGDTRLPSKAEPTGLWTGWIWRHREDSKMSPRLLA